MPDDKPAAAVKPAQTTWPTPRDAATVLFIRDGEQGLEVYLIRRVMQMEFAAGNTAYPGGGVDPRDLDAHYEWEGPSPAEWAKAFFCEERLAKALVAAAVRETFEEAGILLASERGGRVFDVDTDEWEAERLALISKEKSLADVLNARNLVLRSDLVRPWAHWITPPANTKRYDTRFFLMKVPSDIHPRAISTEHDLAEWVPVKQAMAEAADGTRLMWAPTLSTLSDLAQFDTANDALAGAPPRRILPTRPEVIERDGKKYALVDGGEHYIAPGSPDPTQGAANL